MLNVYDDLWFYMMHFSSDIAIYRETHSDSQNLLRPSIIEIVNIRIYKLLDWQIFWTVGLLKECILLSLNNIVKICQTILWTYNQIN